MTPDDKSTSRPDRTMTHADAGAYALGVLSESETAAFEAHLGTCRQCQQELESLMSLTQMLAPAATFGQVGDRNSQAGGRRWIAKALSRLRLYRPTRAQAAALAARDLHDEARRFEQHAARFAGDLAAALRGSTWTDRELP